MEILTVLRLPLGPRASCAEFHPPLTSFIQGMIFSFWEVYSTELNDGHQVPGLELDLVRTNWYWRNQDCIRQKVCSFPNKPRDSVMLKIYELCLTPFYQNARILADTALGVATVVDPGGEVDKILEVLKQHSLHCVQIWLTHSHLDHCGGVARLIQETGAKLYAHRADKYLRAQVEIEAESCGILERGLENCPEPDRYIEDGDVLNIGSYKFTVLHTPGHTPGHVAFLNEDAKVIISGDSLFHGAIGRVDLPGGNAEELLKSIRAKLCTLSSDTQVLCGHGNSTTIGHERQTNPFLLAPSF